MDRRCVVLILRRIMYRKKVIYTVDYRSSKPLLLPSVAEPKYIVLTGFER
jgi:hypothetical protein